MSLKKELFDSWEILLENEILEKSIEDVLIRLEYESNFNSKNIFPYEENVFRAFRETKFDECKYVLIGQDPYHNIYNDVPSACGLAFVTENGYINPSLKILCKALNIKEDGNVFKELMLSKKVLLLNASLTVEQGKPNSHRDLWLNTSHLLIREIDSCKSDLVFILLGKDAQGLSHLITKNTIIKGPHPASYLYTGKTDYSNLTSVFQTLSII